MGTKTTRSLIELAVLAAVAVGLTLTFGVAKGLLFTVAATVVYGVTSVLIKFRRVGGSRVLLDGASAVARD